MRKCVAVLPLTREPDSAGRRTPDGGIRKFENSDILDIGLCLRMVYMQLNNMDRLNTDFVFD